MDLTIDRQVEYLGILYQIVEVLLSGHLLVVEKSTFDKGVYPMVVTIIPGE